MKPYNYRKLEIWKKSTEFAVSIYQLTKTTQNMKYMELYHKWDVQLFLLAQILQKGLAAFIQKIFQIFEDCLWISVWAGNTDLIFPKFKLHISGDVSAMIDKVDEIQKIIYVFEKRLN